VTVNPVESPRENEKIAFSSNREGGNWDIYVMNADGSEQTNISNSPAHDSSPSWSPDGTKIAFVSNSNRDLQEEICHECRRK
jgi:Tol biopolymer transport system component